MTAFVTQKYYEAFTKENPLILESGLSLGPVTLAYETYGTLNPDKSNAILVCHALSGDAHAAMAYQDHPDHIGWWNTFIGPNLAIDTNQYYVICSNVIGGCKGSTGPSSLNPETGIPYGTHFPVITISDMVKGQKKLIDQLGIQKLKMVIGGSMGGMQALTWAIDYPDAIASCVPIASTSKLSPQALAFDVVGQSAIITDPNWQKGEYTSDTVPEKGLSIARMIGHITYLSDESMALKFGRKLQEKADYGYDFSTDFQVESYLKHQGNKFVNRFDANSYLYITKAIDYFDLSKKFGSLEKAFLSVTAKFLVAAISTDWLYKPKESKEIVHALMRLNKKVTYLEIESPYGHDAFLMDHNHLGRAVSHFLESLDE